MATIQSDAVQLALDLLVTHPDLRGFFRMFIKRLVNESESHACGVWLLDDAAALHAPNLRSLDAIHLASARRLGAELRAIVTYDRGQAAGAAALRLCMRTVDE